MGSTYVLFQEMPLTGLIKTGMILFISVHYYMVDTWRYQQSSYGNATDSTAFS